MKPCIKSHILSTVGHFLQQTVLGEGPQVFDASFVFRQGHGIINRFCGPMMQPCHAHHLGFGAAPKGRGIQSQIEQVTDSNALRSFPSKRV